VFWELIPEKLQCKFREETTEKISLWGLIVLHNRTMKGLVRCIGATKWLQSKQQITVMAAMTIAHAISNGAIENVDLGYGEALDIVCGTVTATICEYLDKLMRVDISMLEDEV